MTMTSMSRYRRRGTLQNGRRWRRRQDRMGIEGSGNGRTRGIQYSIRGERTRKGIIKKKDFKVKGRGRRMEILKSKMILIKENVTWDDYPLGDEVKAYVPLLIGWWSKLHTSGGAGGKIVKSSGGRFRIAKASKNVKMSIWLKKPIISQGGF